MLKVNIRTVFWLAILSLPLAFYLGTPYAPTLENPPWFLTLTYVGAFAGQIFLLMCLCLGFLVYPILLLFKRITKVAFIYGLSVLCLLHLLLYLDAQAFLTYRYHICYTLIDLFINDQQGIRSLSLDSWISFALNAILILVYDTVAVLIAMMLSWRNFHSKLFVIFILILFGLANFIHAYANVIQINAVVDLKNRIPLYHPLTLNSLLLKTGLVKADDYYEQATIINTEGFLNYPKSTITYFENAREPYNVILISVNNLRYDALNPSLMPFMSNWAQKSLVFTNHYATSNLHVPSVFGLMYGIPSTYLHSALAEHTKPVLFDALEHNQYDSAVFLSEKVIYPELKNTVFLGQDQIMHYGAFNQNVQERDISTVNKLKEFISEHRIDQKFFAYVSLNGIAEYFPFDKPVKLDLKEALGLKPVLDKDVTDSNINFIPNEANVTILEQGEVANSQLPTTQPLIASEEDDSIESIEATPDIVEPILEPTIHPLEQRDLMISYFKDLQQAKQDMPVAKAKEYYSQAVSNMDKLLESILSFIESQGMLYNTIVIVTSDHGEEFNDNPEPFVGSGTNFTDPQVKVPLVVRWPNKQPHTFDDLNSAYNVSTSLLTAVLGVKNKIDDFSVGSDLFNRNNTKYVLATNHREHAIIENERIVLIDDLGMMNFRQKNNQESSDTTRNGYLFDAIKELTLYLLPKESEQEASATQDGELKGEPISQKQ